MCKKKNDDVIARLTFGQLRNVIKTVIEGEDVFNLKDLMSFLEDYEDEGIRVFDNPDYGHNQVLTWTGGDLSKI